MSVNTTMDLMLPYESWNLRVLAEHAAKVARFNFEWKYITLVLFIETTGLGVSDFIRAYGNTVVVRQESLGWVARAHITQFVVYVKYLDDIAAILRFLSRYNIDNTGRFLIVCTDPQCDESEVMKECWNLKIVNVIFIRTSDNLGECQSFTYYPFTPGYCGNTRPRRVNTAGFCDNDDCFRGLYPEKLRNLYLCPIIASTFPQPPFIYIANGTVCGSDGDLLLLLVRMLNATLEVVLPSDGGGWGNIEEGNWTGSLGDVHKNRVNFSITSGAITYMRYSYFQISFPYNSIDIVWVTSPAPPKPGWEKLVYPYTLSVRIALIGIFIIIGMVHYLTKTQKWNKIRKVLKIDFLKRNVVFQSWSIFMGMPARRTPVKPALALIFIIWTCFSFLMRVGYQTVLISSLEVNRYEENYKSFEEAAVENKIPFGGVSSLKEYFWHEVWIQESWQDLQATDIWNTLHKMAAHELEFIVAVNMELVLDFLRLHNGTSRLQILPQKIVNSPSVIYFKKYSPLAAPISRLLSIAMEGGFSQKLYGNYAPDRNILKEAIIDRGSVADKDKPRALAFKQFSGCWILICGGWILATIIFIIEVLYHRRHHHRRSSL